MSFDENDYAKGFEQGFRAIRGSMAMLPMLPMQPMTPMGSTPFRVGIIVGMKKAGATVTIGNGSVVNKAK